MAGYKSIDPKGGNTFSSTNQPKNNGRKPSIKKQLYELLEKDGKFIVSSKNVIKIEDCGDVIVKIPTEMQLALKLFKIAMEGKSHTTLKAIQMIIEQIDGKSVPNTTPTSAENGTENQIVTFYIPDNGRQNLIDEDADYVPSEE
jgi:hypothetical protein